MWVEVVLEIGRSAAAAEPRDKNKREVQINAARGETEAQVPQKNRKQAHQALQERNSEGRLPPGNPAIYLTVRHFLRLDNHMVE